jgi:heme-degrading monooxygenase HmoA
MAVMMIAELPGVTADQYDAVNAKLGLPKDGEPEGLIQHLAGPTGDGWIVVDVWESLEQFERFFGEGGAAEAIAEVGAPPVEPRVLPLHNMIRQGAGTEANVFLVIEAEGFTPEMYDELTSKMPAHAGDGSSHGAVSHAAARANGGMVIVDVWDSPESFQRFAEEQIAQADADLDLSTMDTRVVPVHNRFAN